jgi:molybdopterin converting factor small subunit
MITILFFGDLGKKIQSASTEGSSPVILHVEPGAFNRVSDILDTYKIDRGETSHIFVNGVYAGFSKLVKDGDRVGIFPRKMCLLYKWYFTRAEDE